VLGSDVAELHLISHDELSASQLLAAMIRSMPDMDVISYTLHSTCKLLC